jgi:hypothetical protein
MGQYYKIVNVKKRQYITPHIFGDGAKLMEFSMSANGVLAGLAILLADGNGRGGGDLHSDNEIVGSWAGDNIVIAGDYADNGKFLPVDKIDRNLYDVVSDEGEDISLKVLDALFDDNYFFQDFRKTTSLFSSDPVNQLIEKKLKEKGLTKPQEWKVPSSKDPNIIYKVTEDNGNWECDCPSFAYSGGQECKHIRETKQNIGNVN